MNDDDPPAKVQSPEQKQQRKAQQAQDGAKALKEYREREMAMRDRTAKLRAQRLAREAAQPAEAAKPAPAKKAAEAKKPSEAKKPAPKKKKDAK